MAENKATAGPRQTSPAKYVAIVFLVASSIGAYWVATSAQQAPGLLHVDPTALDIGEVWESDSFAWSLPIQNRGAADCHIIGFLNSCNCVSIEPTALTIRTGQTESLALRLNLGGGDSRASDSVREFTTHIQPLFAGNERYHPPWTITGRIRKPVSFSPAPELTTDALVVETQWPDHEVRFTVHRPMFSMRASCPLASVTVRPSPTATNVYIATLRFRDSLRPGNHRSELVVTPFDAHGEPLCRALLPVVATVVDDVQLLPSTLAFGVHDCGTIVEDVVTLRSRTGQSMEVVAAIASEQNLDCVSLPSDSRLESRYRIRQRMVAAGHQQTSLTFHIRQRDKEYDLKLPVVYHGRPNE